MSRASETKGIGKRSDLMLLESEVWTVGNSLAYPCVGLVLVAHSSCPES